MHLYLSRPWDLVIRHLCRRCRRTGTSPSEEEAKSANHGRSRAIVATHPRSRWPLEGGKKVAPTLPSSRPGSTTRRPPSANLVDHCRFSRVSAGRSLWYALFLASRIIAALSLGGSPIVLLSFFLCPHPVPPLVGRTGSLSGEPRSPSILSSTSRKIRANAAQECRGRNREEDDHKQPR